MDSGIKRFANWILNRKQGIIVILFFLISMYILVRQSQILDSVNLLTGEIEELTAKTESISGNYNSSGIHPLIMTPEIERIIKQKKETGKWPTK